MIRRAFFNSMAGIFGMLTAPGARTVQGQATCRDNHGRILADPYVKQPDGRWLKTRHEDVQPGAEVVIFGLDGDELFYLTTLTADPRSTGYVRCDDGAPGVQPQLGSVNRIV